MVKTNDTEIILNLLVYSSKKCSRRNVAITLKCFNNRNSLVVITEYIKFQEFQIKNYKKNLCVCEDEAEKEEEEPHKETYL